MKFVLVYDKLIHKIPPTLLANVNYEVALKNKYFPIESNKAIKIWILLCVNAYTGQEPSSTLLSSYCLNLHCY